ncbi:hypothetical protein [Paracoccus mutanolyticus]|nr:hypothetical protein [Paracoccus mutanolyticus]
MPIRIVPARIGLPGESVSDHNGTVLIAHAHKHETLPRKVNDTPNASR